MPFWQAEVGKIMLETWRSLIFLFLTLEGTFRSWGISDKINTLDEIVFVFIRFLFCLNSACLREPPCLLYVVHLLTSDYIYLTYR